MSAVRAYAALLVATGPRRLAFALGLMVAASFTEGAGIAVLIAILSAAGLDVDGQGAVAGLAASMRHALAVVGIAPGLFPLLMLFVLVTGARALLGRIQTLAIFDVEQRSVVVLRTRLYRAIIEADWIELSRARSTDFSAALIEQCGRLGHATFQILQIVADLVVSAILVGLALSVSVPTTLFVLAAGTLLLFVHANSVRLIHEEGTAYAAAMGELHVASTEPIQSSKLIKMLAAQDRTISVFVGVAEKLASLDRAMTVRQSRVSTWFEIGSTLTIAAMLYIGAGILRLPAASLLTLVFLFYRLMPRFMSGHQNIRTFASSLPSFETVMNLIERWERAAEPQASPVARARTITREVRLDRVSFGYGRNGWPTLHAIDLTIPRGGVVGLAGPSGAGKSTVVNLVCGLLVGDAGHLVLDGETLMRGDLRGWREAVGYVGVDTPLLHASLRANMHWARPGASDEEIAEVLRIAAVDELVTSWPDGLGTLLGDRGALLSQGERQRIGLARALLRRPALLVLDEATNGLDAETELRVMTGLRRARPDLAILLVAHRLSTLHFADSITVIEEGRIVESGTWGDLTGCPNSRFTSLNDAQRLG